MSYYKPYYKDKTGAIKEFPIDASTLGGLPPSDYAKTSDISFIDIGVISEPIFNSSEVATQGLLNIVDTAVSYNNATHVKGISDDGCDPFITLLDYACGEGTYIGGTSIIRFYFSPSYDDEQGNLREGSIEIIDTSSYTISEINDILTNYIKMGTHTDNSIYMSYKSISAYAANYTSGVTLNDTEAGLFGGGSSIYLKDNDISINGNSFNELYNKVQELYGNYITFSIDNSINYTKTVPTNVEKYATVNKVGGVCKYTDNILVLNDVSNTTINGITYSIKNGIITLNGTSTATSKFSLFTLTLNNIPDNYSFYFKPEGIITTTNAFSMFLFSSNWSNSTLFNMNNNINGTVIDTYKPAYMQLDIEPGYTFNNTIVKPMLIKQNRNTWKFNNISSTTTNGITYSCTNGVLTIKGTATEQTPIYLQLANPITLYGGLYHISIGKKITSTTTSFLNVYYESSDGTAIQLPTPSYNGTTSYCVNATSDSLYLTGRTTTLTKIAICIGANDSVDTVITPMLFLSKYNLMSIELNKEATVKNGLTYTITNGRILLNGTTTAATDITISGGNIPIGRYQYISMYSSGTTTGTIGTNIHLHGRTSDWRNQVSLGKGTVNTTADIKNFNIYINSNVTFNNYVICPLLFSPYVVPEFSEGSSGLNISPIHTVKSIGTNLLNSACLLGNGYVGALGGELSATTTSKMYDYIPVGNNTQVVVILNDYSNVSNAYTNRLGCYDKYKAFLGFISINPVTTASTYILNEGTKYIRISIDNNVAKPLVSFDTTLTEYVAPEGVRSLSIPQNLNDYGLSLNGVYNYIDLDNNKYNQYLASYIIKESDIVESGSYFANMKTYVINGLSNLIKKHMDSASSISPYVYIEGLTTIIGDRLWMGWDGVTSNHVGSIRIFRHDIQTLEAAKEFLVGKTIIYELIEPIITSLTYEYDNIIEVKPNGTIISENEYKYDVPSEIEYQVKAGN